MEQCVEHFPLVNGPFPVYPRFSMKYNSALLTEASGSLGGTTFSKGRNGSYTRKRVKPTNPRTNSQLRVRTILADFSRGWAGLTDGQRTEWNTYASQATYIDKLGNKSKLSGINWYVRLNAQIAEFGGTAIDMPPAGDRPVDPLSITIQGQIVDEVLVGVQVKEFQPLSIGNGAALYASAPIKVSRSFVPKAETRIATIIAAQGNEYVDTFVNGQPSNGGFVDVNVSVLPGYFRRLRLAGVSAEGYQLGNVFYRLNADGSVVPA